MSYSYERVATFGDVHYRVRDAADNRVATCYVEDNAKTIVAALNLADGKAITNITNITVEGRKFNNEERDAIIEECARVGWASSLDGAPVGYAIRQMKSGAHPQRASLVTEEMVNRFLSWPLPESVCADLCATIQGTGRVGTNLLSALEAGQMLKYVLDADAA